MRYAGNNEIPHHKWFNMDAVKPLAEQQGTWIISRGLYKDPEPWRPMCGLGFTGNHPLVLDDQQCDDGGNKRRLNYLKMLVKFPSDEQKDVKSMINSGCLNDEIFWLVRKLYPYLMSTTGSRVLPRPPRVIKETLQLLEQTTKKKMRAFLDQHSVPAATYAQASNIKQLKDCLQIVFNLNPSEWKALSHAAGLRQKVSGSAGRVWAYQYPEEVLLRAVQLKDSAFEAATAAAAAAAAAAGAPEGDADEDDEDDAAENA
jgi:hypothetical protein